MYIILTPYIDRLYVFGHKLNGGMDFQEKGMR